MLSVSQLPLSPSSFHAVNSGGVSYSPTQRPSPMPTQKQQLPLPLPLPLHLPRVEYLNESQFTLGAKHACAMTSMYLCYYFLNSTTPSIENVIKTMRGACQDWLDDLHARKHDGTFELAVEAKHRHEDLECNMVEVPDLCAVGLMFARPELYDAVPESYRTDFMYKGLLPALKRLETFVRDNLEVGSARAFCFARAGYTMGGCVRRIAARQVRFDLFDTHERIFPAPFLPTLIVNGNYESSAVWITCLTAEEAVQFIEQMFPPATDTRALYALQQNAAQETQASCATTVVHGTGQRIRLPVSCVVTPGPQYTFDVFALRYETDQAARQALAKQLGKQPYAILSAPRN